MTIQERINQLVEDEGFENSQFLKDLVNAQSAEDTKVVLQRHGIDVSLDEVNDLIKTGATILNNAEDNELSELELEKVAGGGKWRGAIRQLATYVGVAGVGLGMVALCAVCPEGAPAWIAAGKVGMIAIGAAGTVWTMKGYHKKGW